jgi:hypothetical protein
LIFFFISVGNSTHFKTTTSSPAPPHILQTQAALLYSLCGPALLLYLLRSPPLIISVGGHPFTEAPPQDSVKRACMYCRANLKVLPPPSILHPQKISSLVFQCVSDPDSLNTDPDPDPGMLLHPDPVWIPIQTKMSDQKPPCTIVHVFLNSPAKDIQASREAASPTKNSSNMNLFHFFYSVGFRGSGSLYFSF